MKHVPDTMQKVSDYEHNWHANTQKTEDSEYDRASGLKLPRFLIPKIGSEGQIKSRDSNEEQSKKICSAFAENNFCEMHIDPAAAKHPITT